MTLSPSHRIATVIIGCLLFLAAELVAPRIAHAVPVFARKYATSCQTCHVAFPKLTPFGEAFRRSGYRFPAGEEEDAAQQEPVALGHEAHKRVFPNTVWPGQVPGGAPIAVQMGSSILLTPNKETEISFANVGANVGLNFVATLDDTFSAWAGAAVRASSSGGAEAELERVFVFVKPFEDPTVNLRIGRFEPTVVGVTMHRTLGFAPWIVFTTVGDNQWSLDPTQIGIEVNGIVAAGRVNYAAGLVEGTGNQLNTPKDGYGRVAYKLGGMRYDGVGGATDANPWRETSLQIGAFGYYGKATIGDPAVATQTDRFYVAGGDINLAWSDLNLVAAFAYGNNRRPELASPKEEMTHWNAYTQVDYVVWPWLIPTVRYERRKIGDATGDRISGGVYALLRANVRVQALASVEGTEGDYEFGQALAGLNIAF